MVLGNLNFADHDLAHLKLNRITLNLKIIFEMFDIDVHLRFG